MRPRRVGIVTAMIQEMNALRNELSLQRHDLEGATGYRGAHDGIDVVAAVTGMGTASAHRVTSALLDRYPVDHLCVVGIAGAVDPAIDIGALVTPEFVVDASSGSRLQPSTHGRRTARGTVLTTDELFNDPADLAPLIRDGVVAVDMETAAIGAVCDARGVGWSVFRAVSDRAGDPATDASVMGMAGADGSPDLPAVLGYVVRHPLRVRHLARLARGTRLATRTAARAAASFVSEL